MKTWWISARKESGVSKAIGDSNNVEISVRGLVNGESKLIARVYAHLLDGKLVVTVYNELDNTVLGEISTWKNTG